MKHSTIIFRSFMFMLLVLCISASAVNTVTAGSLTFDYDVVFSGDTPGGSAPYLTALFDDTAAGAGYDVRLTMSAINLVPGVESVEQWYFNLNPLLDPTLLEFYAVDVTDSNPENGKQQNGIFTGLNEFQSDGDGAYDILFDFPPPTGQFTERFTDDETVIYDIRYTGGSITASSFNFFSDMGGSQGTYLAAAHIKDTPGTEGSGWVGVVPEPISSTLFLVGAATLGFRRFRKTNKV